MADRITLKQSYPYVATDADVAGVLADLSRRTGMIVRLSENVRGTISLDNSSGTVTTLLDEVVAQIGATWWFDGVIAHVEPQAGLSSSLVVSQGLSVGTVREEMQALDLFDDRFPLTSTGDGSVIRISGPQGYVSDVQELIQSLVTTRRARTGTPEEVGQYLPRVYYGRAIN